MVSRALKPCRQSNKGFSVLRSTSVRNSSTYVEDEHLKTLDKLLSARAPLPAPVRVRVFGYVQYAHYRSSIRRAVRLDKCILLTIPTNSLYYYNPGTKESHFSRRGGH